jgi:alpha-tubulin suppressor-like RCC1 family protein
MSRKIIFVLLASAFLFQCDFLTVQPVAEPVLRPDFGTFVGKVLVSISCDTDGSTIKYTTDGSVPSRTNGKTYKKPFYVYDDAFITAMAYKDGWNWTDSHFGYSELTITPYPQAYPPTISPTNSTHTGSVTVSLSSYSSNAQFRFTLDGSTPSETHGIIYEGPFVLTSETLEHQVRAIAYGEEYQASRVSIRNYTINPTPTAAIPTFTPEPGLFYDSVVVSLETETPWASIRYTIDGSDPSETNGTTYHAPFELTSPTEVRALAFLNDYHNSPIAVGNFEVIPRPTTEAPIFTPEAGHFFDFALISLESPTEGASIRYTTDGSDPSETIGTLYEAPFEITADTEIRAIAYKEEFYNSSISSANYSITIRPPTLAPIFTNRSGEYYDGVLIKMASLTEGASIRYTLDGTDPTEEIGTLYSNQFSITQSSTVKAIAFKDGHRPSPITEENYTITPRPTTEAPVIIPESGTYPDRVIVHMSSATEGASIRYTLDGSNPNQTTSNLYQDPFVISTNTVVKAQAYKDPFFNSSVTTRNFEIEPTTKSLQLELGRFAVLLDWTALRQVEEYIVHRKPSVGGSWTEIARIEGATSEYKDTTVNSHTAYDYRVEFRDIFGTYDLAQNSILTEDFSTIISGEELAFGSDSSLRVLDDGRVKAYGMNRYGQFLSESPQLSTEGVILPGLNDVVSVAMNSHGSNCFALTHEGKLYHWGEGQRLGSSPYLYESFSRPIVQILVHWYDFMALDADGNVWIWDSYDSGPSLVTRSTEELPEFVQISMGNGESFSALTSEGEVYTWGANWSGQLGHGHKYGVSEPTIVPDIPSAKRVESINNKTFIILENGDVLAAGGGYNNDLGMPTDLHLNFFKLPELNNIVGISKVSQGIWALKENGTIRYTGGVWDPLTVYSYPGQTETVKTLTIAPDNIVKIYGQEQGVILKDDLGGYYTWGDNTHGQLMLGTENPPINPTSHKLTDPIHYH